MRRFPWKVAIWTAAMLALGVATTALAQGTSCTLITCTDRNTVCIYACMDMRGGSMTCTVHCPGRGVPCSTTCQ